MRTPTCWDASGDGARRRGAEPSILQAAGAATGRRPGGPLVRVMGSVEIDRPASEVWAYVADFGNDPSWRAAVTQLRHRSLDRPRLASPPTSGCGCWA
jgi:uncharacterized membrane protein